MTQVVMASSSQHVDPSRVPAGRLRWALALPFLIPAGLAVLGGLLTLLPNNPIVDRLTRIAFLPTRALVLYALPFSLVVAPLWTLAGRLTWHQVRVAVVVLPAAVVALTLFEVQMANRVAQQRLVRQYPGTIVQFGLIAGYLYALICWFFLAARSRTTGRAQAERRRVQLHL